MSSPTYVPAPPKLAYMSSGLRAARTASAGTRSASGRRSRPGTAGSAASAAAAAMAAQKELAPSPSRPGTATSRSKRAFLQDNEAAATVLPQPLPAGIPYVAAFTTYDDLIDRKILSQPEKHQVRLTTEDVRLMYDAKCADQALKPSWDREMRFLELLSRSCRGQQFVLRENGLGANSAEAISRVLAHNETFTVLDLSGNRIKDSGARALSSLLQSNDLILHLGLKSNDIGPDGIVALCDALHENSTLTSLDLGGIRGINRNHVGGRGAEALGNLLSMNAVLHTLDMGSNGLGLEGCGLIAAGLRNNVTLRRLFLSSNNIGPDGCRLLASVLQDCKLEHLDLRRNGIGDVGAAHIAAAYKAGTDGGESILELQLDHNEIREAGCRALAPSLRTNQSLRHLWLSGNALGPGLSHLFNNLRDNRRMRTLHLVQVGMHDEEAKALARMLDQGSSLETVDLSRNRMSDAAGVALFNSLVRNGQLTSISAAGCSFGNDTARALATVLGANKTLTSINLKQNLFSGTVGDIMHEELKQNPHVRVLDLTYNDIPYLSQTGISAVIDENNDAWRKGEGKRLEREKEELAFAQRELFQVEEDVVSERRAIAEKQDELARRRETARGQAEMNNRVLREIGERVAAVRAVREEKEENLRRVRDELDGKQRGLEARVTKLHRQMELERDGIERAHRDCEKAKRVLKTAEDAQATELRPLTLEFEAADEERRNVRSDAQWQAELTIEIEMRILELERVLKVAPDRRAAAAAAAAGGDGPQGITPRKPSMKRS